jgi:hypothetical protein
VLRVLITRDALGEEDPSPGGVLDQAIGWLASQSPAQPLLETKASLADALQHRVDVLWVLPSSASPECCVGSFNRVVTQLATDLRALTHIAWPIPGEHGLHHMLSLSAQTLQIKLVIALQQTGTALIGSTLWWSPWRACCSLSSAGGWSTCVTSCWREGSTRLSSGGLQPCVTSDSSRTRHMTTLLRMRSMPQCALNSD